MAVRRRSALKPAASPGLSTVSPLVLDQHEFAFEDVDELVFLLVPVAQRRRGAGLERRQIDAELVSPAALPSRLRSRPATTRLNGSG